MLRKNDLVVLFSGSSDGKICLFLHYRFFSGSSDGKTNYFLHIKFF